jgi:hypothetical protein
MASRLACLLLIACLAPVAAQEADDLLGTWTFKVDGLEPHPQCGESLQTGTLQIERKVTARAYRGRVRAEDSYEKCEGTQTTESMVTVRAKDEGRVTIDYDEDGREMERLRFEDGGMTGSRSNGVSTHWERLPEQAAEGPTAEQIAALDAFLSQIEPDLASTLRSEYREDLRKNLVRTGLNGEEAGQVADLTIDRMTSCMLVELRDAVDAQEIPVKKILDEQNVQVIFNPQSMDMRANACIQDAAWNAGVRIR